MFKNKLVAIDLTLEDYQGYSRILQHLNYSHKQADDIILQKDSKNTLPMLAEMHQQLITYSFKHQDIATLLKYDDALERLEYIRQRFNELLEKFTPEQITTITNCLEGIENLKIALEHYQELTSLNFTSEHIVSISSGNNGVNNVKSLIEHSSMIVNHAELLAPSHTFASGHDGSSNVYLAAEIESDCRWRSTHQTRNPTFSHVRFQNPSYLQPQAPIADTGLSRPSGVGTPMAFFPTVPTTVPTYFGAKQSTTASHPTIASSTINSTSSPQKTPGIEHSKDHRSSQNLSEHDMSVLMRKGFSAFQAHTLINMGVSTTVIEHLSLLAKHSCTHDQIIELAKSGLRNLFNFINKLQRVDSLNIPQRL